MSARLPDRLSTSQASPGTLAGTSRVSGAAFSKVLSGLLANDWAIAGLIFAFTRLVALAGAYSGVSRLVQTEPARSKGWLTELALMWDSAWYAGIAQSGYTWHPGATGGTNVAFAPLYPLLLRAVSTLLGWVTFGWDWGNQTYGTLIAAGLLISNLSFFVALALLVRLLAPRLGRGGAALVALALASLPLSFFFSAIYTEGPFLMLSLASLVIARSDWGMKWPAAASLGMLASLLKFAGVLILPVLAIEYLSQRGWSLRKVRLDFLWLGIVPLGIVAYMGYLWAQFGNPLAFMDSEQKGWNHQASFFLLTYWDSAVQLYHSLTGFFPPGQDTVLYYGNGSRLYIALDLAMPLLLLAGGLLVRKKLLASEWTWLALGIIYPLSENITFSLARYVLPLWPGLIWLGTLGRRSRWIAVAWLAVSLALLAWCASIFGSANWIG
jgi:hypothetical protein